ncbi:unnamed protein product, partial [Rhizoctonia solani]
MNILRTLFNPHHSVHHNDPWCYEGWASAISHLSSYTRYRNCSPSCIYPNVTPRYWGSQPIRDITHQLTRNLTEMEFSVQFIKLPSSESITPEPADPEAKSEQQPLPMLKPMANDAIVNILHSSGSTGLPRPVEYHLEGVFQNLINQLLFGPSRIPVVPTSKLTIEAAVSTNCAFMMCVPAFLETWSEDKDALVHLRQMKGVMFGGAPLAESIGDKLVNQGVRIHYCYGATEVGHVHEIWDLDGPSDWGYIKFSSHVDARFIPQNDMDQTFELVFVTSGDHRPFVVNSEMDGKPAYKTKDLVVRHPSKPDLWKLKFEIRLLVVRHPSKPDLWKLFGRLDDQIILNGEKVNPGPM